ncbi:MAG: ATP-binding cassette domain-containing protein [Ignavibacteria bacterium]|nr:ATP-binding cassette domain-containing protein [Ignavibacteria bacterium]
MLKIENIFVSFGKNKVLNGLSLSAEMGEVHGIVGLNGSGKTTFFNTLAGIVKPDSGNILLNENNVRRLDTGFVETENYFYSNITGNEYLNIFPSSNEKFILDAFNDLFKLPLDSIIETYSNGMKKKLAIMGVLKQDKQIYIFDEPFNGLDMETCKILEIVIDILRGKNKTILISSHILESLTDVCTNIHLLKDGVIKESFEAGNYQILKHDLFDELKISAGSIVKSSL